MDIKFLFSCSTRHLTRINNGVIQGFPAPRKDVTSHVKKYDIFSRVFDITNQLLTRYSPFAPLGQVDEWMAKPSPFSTQSRLSETFRINGCLDTEKFVSLTASDSDVQTFLGGEENQNTERKTESYVFSGFGNGIFRGWERKSTTRRFATGQFWPCTWKISFVGKDQVDN